MNSLTISPSKLEDIFRILYCGNCKHIWQMRGKLKVLKSKVRRTFSCPYCKELVKTDWFKDPSYRAIDPRKYTYPMFYDSEQVRFNRELLGLDTTLGMDY